MAKSIGWRFELPGDHRSEFDLLEVTTLEIGSVSYTAKVVEIDEHRTVLLIQGEA